MKAKIEGIVAELKSAGQERLPYTNNRESDPEAKVNVWYIVAKVEEAILSDSKNNKMGLGLRKLIAELKKSATRVISCDLDPDAKVNVWYVIARLQEILLED